MLGCVLTTGFALDCRESIGGVDEIFIAEFSNIESIGVVSGVVTGITMVGSSKFYRYGTRKGATEAKSDVGGDIAAGSSFIIQQVILQMDMFSVAKSIELRKTQKKPVAIIVKDANGLYMLYGATRGLDASTGTGQTGKAAADLNGYTITYQGEEQDYPYGMSAAQVTALL